jgi:hypothetical protein
MENGGYLEHANIGQQILVLYSLFYIVSKSYSHSRNNFNELFIRCNFLEISLEFSFWIYRYVNKIAIEIIFYRPETVQRAPVRPEPFQYGFQ